MRATIAPVFVSITSTTLAVEAETSTCLPSGEIAMWSARFPSTFVRQMIFRVLRFSAITSARLGRETYRRRPLREENMSSTNWSCPSPTAWRIARK